MLRDVLSMSWKNSADKQSDENEVAFFYAFSTGIINLGADFSISGPEVIKQEGNRKWLRFNRDVMSASLLISRISAFPLYRKSILQWTDQSQKNHFLNYVRLDL